MKRDMDLVRKILLAIETNESGFAPRDLGIEGHTYEQVGYQVFILTQSGLLTGTEATHTQSKSPEALANALTWEGHEFLDAARNEKRWGEAKGLLDKAGGAAIAVWVTVLSKIVMQHLGIG